MSEPFSLTGPLPHGVTVLEASAGTGKTYTIEGLVARYVAEGVPLRKILVVTFTRAATAELRDRVRTRLVRVEAHLSAIIDGGVPHTDDAVAALLAEHDLRAIQRRRDLLTEALADFDAATINTIHGFCQQVLAGVGLSGDLDRQATLLEDDRDVIDAVVDDVLVRRFAGGGSEVLVPRGPMRKIAGAVVANPDARIIPTAPTTDEARLRVELARQVRAEVDDRKRAFGLLSYNDLLTRLAATLRDSSRGHTARQRLRDQYDVALIDEFQDTDPIQWEIFDRVFGKDAAAPPSAPGGDGPARSLVLIGDPKQAIYAFRGADVYAYLRASQGRVPQTLGTNWRSDQRLLDAFNVVFSGAELGHERIPYRPVEAAPAHQDPRLVGAPSPAALRLRVMRADDGLRTNNRGRSIVTDAARAHIASDVAVQVVELLSSPAEIIDRASDGTERDRRRVRPADIAVLVRSNADAALVQRKLREADVPAVINGVGSVFATAAATDWLRLLEALEQPSVGSRARTAALTLFLGWTGDEAAAADDEAWDGVHEKLRRWAGILRDRSVASLLQTILAQERLPERLLPVPDGERHLTDVEHVSELLHAAAISEELGVSALTGWLRARIRESGEDDDADERARRLESDAEAVQVLTIHRSKGLEWPVVLAPFLWSSRANFGDGVPIFHDLEGNGQRVVDVGGKEEPGYDAHVLNARDEARGEELRLVYVALTRARHQSIVWWVPAGYAKDAPLSRLLLCRKSANGDVLNAGSFSLKPDDLTRQDLDALAARTNGAMAVESMPLELPDVLWTGGDRDPVRLAAADFDRDLDLRWRRTSYSALTRAAHDATHQVASEPDVDVTDDEAMPPVIDSAEPAAAEEQHVRSVLSPLAEMKGGVDVGTFVHGVFEDVDFTAADLTAELLEHVTKQQQRRHVDVGDTDMVVDGLARAISTPLGPLVGDVRLRDIGAKDRMDEMGFELPLVGGSAPTGGLAVADIAAVLRRHVAAGDPLDGYAERLEDPVFATGIRGYLNGSIDVVLRTPSGMAVVDYKTNWLGVDGEPLSAWHYTPQAMAAAMQRAHYPLQALLYVVALHRYLRWRMPGYAPEKNLAGVLYLFIRGMTGPDVPRVDGQPCGVFSWRPPADLVVELSDLLDRGAVAA